MSDVYGYNGYGYEPNKLMVELTENEEYNLSEWLAPLIKNRLAIALIVASCFIFAVIYNFQAPPVYQASSSVILRARTIEIMRTRETQNTQIQDIRGILTIIATITAKPLRNEVAKRVVESGIIEDRLVRDRYHDKSPEQKLEYISKMGDRIKLNVENPKWTNYVIITYNDNNPVLAREVVNLAARIMVEFDDRDRELSMNKSSELINKQIQDARSEVEESEKKLYAFRNKYNMVGLDVDKNLEAQRLSSTTARLDDVQDNIHTLLSQITQLDELMKRKDFTRYTPVGTENDILERLREKLVLARIEYEKLLIVYEGNHPEVKKAAGEIAVIEESFIKELKVTREKLVFQMNVLRAREDLINKNLDNMEQNAVKNTEKDIEYSVLTRDAEKSRDIYEKLLTAGTEISISMNTQIDKFITVHELADTPDKPISPRKALNLLLGLGLGVVLGVAFAFGREYLDQTIRRPEDVNRAVKLPVLSIVPLYALDAQDIKSKDIFLTKHPKSLFAEGITSLRTHLNIKVPNEGPVALVVTSSAPREGKSLISSNLSLSMAIDGKRTLLVDADLHRPSIHKIFEMPRNRGLSDIIITQMNVALSEIDPREISFRDIQYLVSLKHWTGTVKVIWGSLESPLEISFIDGEAVGSNLDSWRKNVLEPAGSPTPAEPLYTLDEMEIREADKNSTTGAEALAFLSRYPRMNKSTYFRNILERDYIRPTFSENFFVLTAGTTPNNPSEILGSEQMKILVDILKEMFDRVVLDCPPSWPLSDVSIVAPLGHGVLWICRAGETPKNMLQHGVSHIRVVQPNILGVVLNAVDFHREWRYYYGYSSYYYRNYRYRYYREYVEGSPGQDQES